MKPRLKLDGPLGVPNTLDLAHRGSPGVSNTLIWLIGRYRGSSGLSGLNEGHQGSSGGHQGSSGVTGCSKESNLGHRGSSSVPKTLGHWVFQRLIWVIGGHRVFQRL